MKDWRREFENFLCPHCLTGEAHEIQKCGAQNHPNYYQIRGFIARTLKNQREDIISLIEKERFSSATIDRLISLINSSNTLN